MIWKNVTNAFARIQKAEDYESLSRQAAKLIAAEVRRQPGLLLCAAAGSTPSRTYDFLAESRLAQPGLCAHLRVVKLDEWGGLDMKHESTCEAYLQTHLIRPLEIPPERYIALRSSPKDPAAECERVRALLTRHGGVDLCVLGLGVNGHLGLNEPAESLQPFVHVASLADSSLQHPMLRLVDGRVAFGLTLGIVDILRSKKIFLLVSGPHKRRPLKRLLTPEISSHFPASFLWLHPDVTLLYDADSA